ncbi:hypothetical protein Q765_05490 [Flavobacterium rivuli WB 3.3-2 = DSM 21788]|uniref:DUF8201 domain-containing protein n=1 Tax=Flavobacterium rivuli WB 3.3-2 = DSM 21788 TaxID=1121895 RepID=A0A0A2M4L6_9FLAO|nr:hypothetical protein [Flavobacterium rivuli]KGO87587.1 hypothetical protein Q765_05490 [Flavobacterium rivuli WB 3.3-2 = DSM 21788]
MIVIAAYWLFLFIITLPLGIITVNVLKLKTQNTVITWLLGVVLLTCGFTLTAFFFPLGAPSLLTWSLLSLSCGIYYKAQVKQQLLAFYTSLMQLPLYLKIVIAIVSIGALLKSAQYPFIIDNEGYYIQTIKWLNQYGFVKGIANLHIFFAQNSAWHVLQAGTNFSFLTGRINDINGFVFILCMAYCITEGHALSQPGKQYWLSFMPLCTIFPFLFLDVPSPDLPLLLLTPIVLHLYIKDNNSNSNFKVALLLFTFLVFIKLTIAPLGLIFITGLLKKENIKFALAAAMPIMVLWVFKNILSSGYPLYPFGFFKTNSDWAIPKELLDLMAYINSGYGYKRNGSLLPEGTAITTKLLYWIKQDGLAGIVNKVTLAVLFIMPFCIINDKKYRLAYVALLVNFLAVLFTSPQFRYFLHLTLTGSLFVIAALYNYIKVNAGVYKIIVVAGSSMIFVTFFSFGLSALTTNKHHHEQSKITFQQLYLPETITKYPNMQFEKVRSGNLEYYSPRHNFLLFGTANGPLPCVNRVQIEFMQKRLGITPQLRTKDIKDGFYSAKTPKK